MMNADWITSPSARRVLQHAADSRPAWLWSRDGLSLLWQNDAAPLFLAKLKKHGLKPAPPAAPIKGQIARNIRLGSTGRTSLARIQFIAGDKPASSTCATTPLIWQDGQTVLLVVGVDPIAPEILNAAREEPDAAASAIFATAAASQGEIVAEAPALQDDAATVEAAPFVDAKIESPELYRDEPVDGPAPEADSEPIAPVMTADDEVAAAQDALDEPEQSVDEALGDRPTVTDETAYEQELQNWRDAERDGTAALALVSNDAAEEAEEAQASADSVEEPMQIEAVDAAPAADTAEEAPRSSRLGLLVDRLAADENLFTPLTEDDDAPPAGSEVPARLDDTGHDVVADAADSDGRVLDVTDAEADLENLVALESIDEPASDDADGEQTDVQGFTETSAEPADPDTVERVSRYNFDELARILTDRVGEPATVAPAPAVQGETTRTGALINLGGETLVLNRLPLGILVFRDQQVLFANRAITEMVGYGSVESLRAAGLAAVFPAAGPEGGESAGPINHLVQRDGTLVPVTARLQSISWQGKPALMLSASTTEVRTGHEAAVAAFARSFAELRGDGFFEATRTGVISAVTLNSPNLLREQGMLEGKPLSALVAGAQGAELRAFLERPARFAETARPSLTLRSTSGTADIALFAQGQAGVITGYFGFIRPREAAPVRLAAPADTDPALLARISRGVRRPLNTIIGFADLIRSEAFGALQNERYETYAQDITTAGQEIAALVDELDDYARLREGRYLPQRASIELTSLLESCVLRIRQQASGARVIVRNAISENLPRVTADRASLAQAVLNLLASAIDQTPTGGGVVISAQREDNGDIAVHVRDSSSNAVDMAERFVVFRDGMGRNGQVMVPVRSSIGLALTRSLLAVNAFSLSVDPAGEQGMLFTMLIPANLVEEPATPDVGE
ncbi:His Kinase A (phospho-acceptor) domain-containing protein [Devosia psychrophila]|uniref:histidine kinase n=2 Tax=Devosia psychrophila TaxID=728005 RepID=A0A1I1HTR8_9HYPH|nr:His Kinase A (phospho-acceptor) domain-containing protein [Devosia psychrophila]